MSNFKKGDRVRILNNSLNYCDVYCGFTGIVYRINGVDSIEVMFKRLHDTSGPLFLREDFLELAPLDPRRTSRKSPKYG